MSKKPDQGIPINLLTDRQTRIKVGEQELFVWCDTYKGRLRLRVKLPDGAEVEHFKFTKGGGE